MDIRKYAIHDTFVLAVSILFVSGFGFAQSSENYAIKKDVADIAGGTMSSEQYQVNCTAGEASETGSSESDGYHVNSGFFADQTLVTSVEKQDVEALPNKFQLYQNYPNPFNPVTTIAFDVKESCDVSLVLYDLMGRRAGVLVKDSYDPGSYEVSFDASSLASGIYVYRIRMDSYRAVRKMVLLK